VKSRTHIQTPTLQHEMSLPKSAQEMKKGRESLSGSLSRKRVHYGVKIDTDRVSEKGNSGNERDNLQNQKGKRRNRSLFFLFRLERVVFVVEGQFSLSFLTPTHALF
jgi:hypothetical protein